eukprot:CAMPEP_0114342338 /NCGR_PEP_ID=MMETSP0101-20121206/9727_1 /TAXON_ID=38822 ORGANISM="Pteridomonas danica, Strain PT" /NCGR_SAMPLE_ID=MMETSP0101 /ASSEMBLY_ACC=CAM_ASM_000211 /LENGTH=355 /DNA_ID=CAMNT_0001476401 /DNA_START=80 /DNA_END=1144 /DNA_ORIENTATION=+
MANKQSCDNCSSPSNGTIIFKACSRCKRVYYCSKECQIIHWKSGHKKTCIPVNDPMRVDKTSSDLIENHQLMSSSSQQSKYNPICAICLDSLANTSYILPCKHTFHTNCITSLRSHKGLNQVCPLCRTNLPPSPEEAYMKACCLLKKSFNHSNSAEIQGMDVEIINLLNSSADEGFMFAQFKLGIMYFHGRGVKQNYVKAREWYLKAASQDHAGSQHNLGVIYNKGHGVRQDYVKAREWYLQAASQHNPDAQNNLGVIYHNGQAVQQDFVKAREWYLKAASQHNPDAQNNLGVIYHKGQAVQQDFVKARECYLKAASQGYADSQHNLGAMYYEGQGVKQNFMKAREWYLKAASQG